MRLDKSQSVDSGIVSLGFTPARRNASAVNPDVGYVFPGDRQEEGERSGKGSPKKGNPGEPGGRAMVPLSMLPQRLEGMWASASTNVRLSEVRGIRE